MVSPTTSPARSARSAPGGQPVSRNWLDRPACSSTWFGSGASLWSNRLPPKAVWRSEARVQHVRFYLRRAAAPWLQPSLPAMRTYGVSWAFACQRWRQKMCQDSQFVQSNFGLPLRTSSNANANKPRHDPPNMNTTSKTETAAISKIAPPQKSSVIEITRTSNLHAPPVARNACRSMPRHLSSSPNE